ncbi:MAG: hypothetical protein ACYC2H_03845 [Thermoplasmatota archaeon]
MGPEPCDEACHAEVDDLMDLLDASRKFEIPEGAIIDAKGAVVEVGRRYCKVMSNTCVAQIDFLGFSNLLLRADGSPEFILRTFYQETELHARLGARTDGDRGKPTIALFQYADTLVVVARVQGPTGIVPVVKATSFILASCHGRGLPARAGVSIGDLWASSHQPEGGTDGDFVTGPAVAAAHFVEAAQAWAGGALDPRISWRDRFPEETEALQKEGWLVEYEVPWKAPAKIETLALAINWPQALHMYPEAIWDLLDVQGDEPEDELERRAWTKRKAASDFLGKFPPGPLGHHDIGVFLVSHSGHHFPLMPVGVFLREATEAEQ